VRKEILVIAGIVLLILAVTTQAEITDVFIFPEEPMVIDPITIFVSGVESESVTIDNSDFQINGTSLVLDIYFHSGFLPVVTPWSHSEDIGLLGAGIYELTSNTIFESAPHLNDSYYTTFEVVPEPSTVVLLGIGFVYIRQNKRKRLSQP